MEAVLERMFVVPGINRPIGLDSILGLVPVLGDIVTASMGAWLVWEARNLGMSKFQVARMADNVGIDTLLGAVPLVGHLFDFVFRPNTIGRAPCEERVCQNKYISGVALSLKKQH